MNEEFNEYEANLIAIGIFLFVLLMVLPFIAMII